MWNLCAAAFMHRQHALCEDATPARLPLRGAPQCFSASFTTISCMQHMLIYLCAAAYMHRLDAL